MVDDDEDFRAVTSSFLTARGHEVEQCADGTHALERLGRAGEAFDLVVLDAEMPNASGIDVCQTLRERGDRIRILVLTSHEDESNEVAFLQAGADEFVAKSRGPEVLALRVERTAGGQDDAADEPSSPTALRVGPLEVDAEAQTLHVDGVPVPVRRKELLVLDLLARNVGRYVSTDTLARALAGLRDLPSHSAATKQISRIREALRGTAAEHMLTRRAGSGYQLDPSLATPTGDAEDDRGDR